MIFLLSVLLLISSLLLNHSIAVSLTATGDLLVFLVAAVVIELGVRVVQDGPALRVLHSITVTLVVHLAASMGQKQSKF